MRQFFRRRLRRFLGLPAETPVRPADQSFEDKYHGLVTSGERTLFLSGAACVNVSKRFEAPRIHIGADCMINCEFVFESNEGEISIGSRTFINGGSRLVARQRIEVGSDVMISWGCLLYDHDGHSPDWQDRRNDILRQNEDYRNGLDFRTSKDWRNVQSAPIVVGDKVWIGFDAVILKGVAIGEGAIVGARSVVTRDVPAWTLVAGNPARPIRPITPSEGRTFTE